MLITLWFARANTDSILISVRYFLSVGKWRRRLVAGQNEAASQLLVMESQFDRSLKENRKRLKEDKKRQRRLIIHSRLSRLPKEFHKKEREDLSNYLESVEEDVLIFAARSKLSEQIFPDSTKVFIEVLFKNEQLL